MEGVQDSVNINKMKFESYGELVDQAFSQFNENLISNQYPHSQTKNDEKEGKCPNENNTEEGETNRTSSIPNFMPQILPDDEIAEDINSLNLKQREVFRVVNMGQKLYEI